MNRHNLPQFRIEVIPEHRRTRVAQIQIGIPVKIGGADSLELFTLRDMLDDTGGVSDPHLTEGKGAVTSVIEHQPVFRMNGVLQIDTSVNWRRKRQVGPISP